jgi:hypothetical protein
MAAAPRTAPSKNPETFPASPVIPAPDPGRSITTGSARRVSARQNILRASAHHQRRQTCSQREQLGNSLGTLISMIYKDKC